MCMSLSYRNTLPRQREYLPAGRKCEAYPRERGTNSYGAATRGSLCESLQDGRQGEAPSIAASHILLICDCPINRSGLACLPLER